MRTSLGVVTIIITLRVSQLLSIPVSSKGDEVDHTRFEHSKLALGKSQPVIAVDINPNNCKKDRMLTLNDERQDKGQEIRQTSQQNNMKTKVEDQLGAEVREIYKLKTEVKGKEGPQTMVRENQGAKFKEQVWTEIESREPKNEAKREEQLQVTVREIQEKNFEYQPESEGKEKAQAMVEGNQETKIDKRRKEDLLKTKKEREEQSQITLEKKQRIKFQGLFRTDIEEDQRTDQQDSVPLLWTRMQTAREWAQKLKASKCFGALKKLPSSMSHSLSCKQRTPSKCLGRIKSCTGGGLKWASRSRSNAQITPTPEIDSTLGERNSAPVTDGRPRPPSPGKARPTVDPKPTIEMDETRYGNTREPSVDRDRGDPRHEIIHKPSGGMEMKDPRHSITRKPSADRDDPRHGIIHKPSGDMEMEDCRHSIIRKPSADIKGAEPSDILSKFRPGELESAFAQAGRQSQRARIEGRTPSSPPRKSRGPAVISSDIPYHQRAKIPPKIQNEMFGALPPQKRQSWQK